VSVLVSVLSIHKFCCGNRRVDRLFGEMHIPQDSAAGRR
jgi:hypothetical protein